MKFRFLSSVMALSLLLLSSTSVFAVEQTICFSKTSLGDTNIGGRNITMWQGSLGDDVLLYSGRCGGKTLGEMNKKGWRLIQVVGGLDNAFGMILEKK